MADPLTDPLTDPPEPQPDDKDWTWVLGQPCPECGFDAASLERDQIPEATRKAVGTFQAALRAPRALDRPSPQVWSALEYACHVRDVCSVFGDRLRLMLGEDDPGFANWDQDNTARLGRYWTQDPMAVASQLQVAAEQIARAFADVPDDAWGRTGRRSNGSVFTVESLGRYLAHDLVHHVHDIGR